MAQEPEAGAGTQRGIVFQAAQGLGAMVGAPLGGYLYEHANFPVPSFIHAVKPSHYVPFFGCALLLIVAWLLAMFTIKDKSAKQGSSKPQ